MSEEHVLWKLMGVREADATAHGGRDRDMAHQLWNEDVY